MIPDVSAIAIRGMRIPSLQESRGDRRTAGRRGRPLPVQHREKGPGRWRPQDGPPQALPAPQMPLEELAERYRGQDDHQRRACPRFSEVSVRTGNDLSAPASVAPTVATPPLVDSDIQRTKRLLPRQKPQPPRR